ncbi:vasopressin V2 receptor isoform X2 [Pelmatolapia mariae]|uniref:vasopressin V2 receptor isoform X2 n=1 Tax=Pelmatolapia mariae TaxID=158779 RepID=UPI002FE5EFBB
MESISLETDWDRLGLSALDPTGRNNFSSSFISELNSFNTSHSGGSFFGIFPENGSNSTPRTFPQPRVRDMGLARAEIAVLAVVLALTTLGNSFVLWVLLRRRKHNAPMHIFMVNLCVADLVVAFFQAYRGGAVSRWNTPVMVAWGLALVLSIPQVFIFSRSEVAPGEFECWGHFAELWGLKAYVTWMTVAVFLLPALIITICQIRIFREIHNNIYLKSERMVMAEMKKNEILFRFHSFRKEDERSRERGRRASGGGGWDGRGGQLFKVANNNPHNNTPNSQVGECYDYVPPDIQCNSCHGEHVTTTRTTAHQQTVNGSDCQEPYTNSPRCSLDYAPPHRPATPPPSITKAMSKTVRMTLVIVLVYTICWSPFFIVQLWAAWDPDPPDQGVAFTILMLLASLNSCTNPWIYTAFSSSVSRELQNLLHCGSRSGRRGSLPDDSTTTHTSTTKDSLY